MSWALYSFRKIFELMAEIFGKESGICKGRGGSQHLHYKNFVQMEYWEDLCRKPLVHLSLKDQEVSQGLSEMAQWVREYCMSV